MHGYYGNDSSFNAGLYNVSNGSGIEDPATHTGAYVKKTLREPGTVYVVSGSSGKLGGMQKEFPHKAMYFSDATHGGVSYIEVSGKKLSFKWICADGVIRDQFTIIKKEQ
jgi:hypothetical protein